MGASKQQAALLLAGVGLLLLTLQVREGPLQQALSADSSSSRSSSSRRMYVGSDGQNMSDCTICVQQMPWPHPSQLRQAESPHDTDICSNARVCFAHISAAAQTQLYTSSWQEPELESIMWPAIYDSCHAMADKQSIHSSSVLLWSAVLCLAAVLAVSGCSLLHNWPANLCWQRHFRFFDCPGDLLRRPLLGGWLQLSGPPCQCRGVE
jgi:hypothetical protein